MADEMKLQIISPSVGPSSNSVTSDWLLLDDTNFPLGVYCIKTTSDSERGHVTCTCVQNVLIMLTLSVHLGGNETVNSLTRMCTS
jgi:hypothetical protein